MVDIWCPNTDEIRGIWIAMTHAPEAFDRWFERVQLTERLRAIEIMDKATFHYGKTHSGQTVCKTCDIFLAIQGETE